MAKHIIFQARTPEDSQDFVNLFIMSAPTYIPALFGGTEDKVANNSFRYRHNLLSFEHTHFVKVNGKNAAMLLAYDWRVKKKEAVTVKMTLLTARYMKIKFITQMRHLSWADSVLAKINDGTFYISNIAVYPEFRGKGLGTSLLSHTEEAARKSGANSIAVDVETDNQGAIRFYQRFGFSIIGEPKRTVIKGKEFKFFRMSKNISSPH